MSKKVYKNATAMLATMLLMSACGGGSGTGASASSAPVEGALLNGPPPRTASLTATAFTSALESSQTGKTLLRFVGAPVCGVDLNYIQYATVGGAGEATTASGVLMVPTGSNPRCTGARPIVLYAHGTAVTKAYNLANFTDTTNEAYSASLSIAAQFAAQGYIVVAPNYAGYDSSPLAYHPYLNANQQSRDMIDALSAAKTALPLVASPSTASSKLFLTGSSQGGYVAMATARAMQAAAIPVTASAFVSGPYAMSAFADTVFYGHVSLGFPVIFEMVATSYQKAYGNMYSSPSDVYESAYAPGIETLVPGPYTTTTLSTSGKLPATELFSNTPPTGPAALQPTLDSITPPTGTGSTDALFALGFGPNNLVLNSTRLDYLLDATANPDGAVPTVTTGATAAFPQSPWRIALKKNDLRGWTPTSPVLLCGGHSDPTVFYETNTGLMAQQWAGLGSLVTELDVDSPPAGNRFDSARLYFSSGAAAVAASSGSSAVIEAYHGTLANPACMIAATTFFSSYLN